MDLVGYLYSPATAAREQLVKVPMQQK